MGRKFFIETFGCQMNELDSEKIAGNLCHNGMEPATDASQADIIILNTCSVREKAVQKVYARLGEIKRRTTKQRDLVVGVVGCMAQLEGEKILRKAPFVNILAGPQKGHVITDLVEESLRTHAPAVDMRMDDDPEPLETAHVLRENPWRAAVTISEGCNRHCTFCVVPFTRGAERDREHSNITREVKQLVEQGYVEVVLLGQTVNSYRDPVRRDYTFARLLRELSEIDGLKRIRFTSPHPNDFTDELMEVMVSCRQVCNQVHLPVQSGSTKILRAMRRGYTRERYLETIRKIHDSARPISISTDIIVGFPGETEADFRDTLTLLDEVQYDNVFSFKYSPRPNTAALGLADNTSEEEKGRRLSILQAQQKLIQYNRNAAYLDQVVDVLVDEKARSRFSLAGRATNNKIVNFDGPEILMGQIVPVQVTGFSPNSLKGVWLQ
ncbi:MAG TPA: tRNA (N6-isopentenyl adenosine(37)-C2)-methylthiotransferase MiaB [Acidobacteriota bacterium]|nr:tRNA (N6-isopentenyl adenosine(37)-C2)-methylthiotransferase MiaB [Acidobacteriota bacterium]